MVMPSSLGNLSLAKLLAAWGSPLPYDDSERATRAECEQHIAQAIQLGADALEDLVGWGVVEPEEGCWDWRHYLANARRIHEAGLQYVAFGWPLILPRWVREDDIRFPKAMCLEHRRRSEAQSIFADETIESYDRFYAAFAAAMGEYVDRLRVGSPYDFGETAYLTGCAQALWPQCHAHHGYWCAETAHPDPHHERLAFLEWYYDAYVERMGLIVDAARRHFPSTPILLNYGFLNERPSLGQDITGLARMAASKGVEVRSPWGDRVSFLYTKRTATAAKHAGLTAFSTEPPNATAPPAAVALSAFKVLESGITWHFDYAPNQLRAPDTMQRVRVLWRRGERPEVDVALFFPSWAHRLSTGDPGWPEGLLPFAERLRAVVDFDVLDESLVVSGALGHYATLLWPTLFRVRRATVDAIRRWVAAGGTLLCGDVEHVECLDTAELLPVPAGAVTGLGFEATPWQSDLAVAGGGYTFGELGSGWAEAIGVTSQPCGVLTSTFKDGLLAFNPGHVPAYFRGVELAPLEIRHL